MVADQNPEQNGFSGFDSGRSFRVVMVGLDPFFEGTAATNPRDRTIPYSGLRDTLRICTKLLARLFSSRQRNEWDRN